MALQSIPEDLNKTYEAILSRTPAGEQCVARNILLWLSFAMRALTIDALNQAVMIYETENSTDQDELLGGSAILLDIYCGLIQWILSPPRSHWHTLPLKPF